MKSTSSLVFGILLGSLALVTATGAVSLGQTTFRSGGGAGQATWLVYSPWVFMISIVLASVGMAFAYFAGRDNARAVKE